MVVPSWQEIIDDIIEVLSLKHPALKDVSAISSVPIQSRLVGARADLKDDMIDDMLDTLVIHKFKCGHVIKVPKYMYQAVVKDVTTVCQKCT